MIKSTLKRVMPQIIILALVLAANFLVFPGFSGKRRLLNCWVTSVAMTMPLISVHWAPKPGT